METVLEKFLGLDDDADGINLNDTYFNNRFMEVM
jgi:hypothetical protein